MNENNQLSAEQYLKSNPISSNNQQDSSVKEPTKNLFSDTSAEDYLKNNPIIKEDPIEGVDFMKKAEEVHAENLMKNDFESKPWYRKSLSSGVKELEKVPGLGTVLNPLGDFKIPEMKPFFSEKDFKSRDNMLSEIGANVGMTFANLIPSAVNLGTGLVNAVSHPLETAGAVGDLVKGGVESGLNAIGVPVGDTESQDISKKAFQQIIVDRYGSNEGFTKALHEDPAGILTDILTVASAGAGVASKAGLLPKVADASKVADISKVADTATDITKVADTATDVAKVAKPLSKAAEDAANRILGGVRNSEDAFQALEEIAKNGKATDFETIGKAVESGKKAVGKELEDIIEKSTKLEKTTKPSEFAGEALRVIEKELKNLPKSSTNKETLSMVKELMSKNKTPEGLSIADLQEAKKMINKYNKLYNEGGKEVSGLLSDSLRQLRRDIAKEIETRVKEVGFDVKKVNEKYGSYESLEEINYANQAKLKKFLSNNVIEKTSKIGELIGNGIKLTLEAPGIKQILTEPIKKAITDVFKLKSATHLEISDVNELVPKLLKILKDGKVPDSVAKKIVDFAKPKLIPAIQAHINDMKESGNEVIEDNKNKSLSGQSTFEDKDDPYYSILNNEK